MRANRHATGQGAVVGNEEVSSGEASNVADKVVAANNVAADSNVADSNVADKAEGARAKVAAHRRKAVASRNPKGDKVAAVKVDPPVRRQARVVAVVAKDRGADAVILGVDKDAVGTTDLAMVGEAERSRANPSRTVSSRNQKTNQSPTPCRRVMNPCVRSAT